MLEMTRFRLILPLLLAMGGVAQSQEMKVYENSRYDFHLTYPADWKVEERAGDACLWVVRLRGKAKDQADPRGLTVEVDVFELTKPIGDEASEHVRESRANWEETTWTDPVVTRLRDGNAAYLIETRFKDSKALSRTLMTEYRGVGFLVNVLDAGEKDDASRATALAVFDSFGVGKRPK